MQPRLLCVFGAVLCGVGALCAIAADNVQGVYATPEEAAADPDFALQGEYVGEKLGLQVVAQGKGEFLVITYRDGLPGAGWNGTEKQETDEKTEDVQGLIKDLKLKKVERKSPTLAASPPPGAVVLFDGTEESLKQHWEVGAAIDKGLLSQGCTSTDKFQDFALHIEFRLPYMPLARGQGRGNSGIYYQGRYETQMLDSFGLAGKDNECGGLYTIKAPDLNMCLPPLAWQTYDVEYTAARFDAEGKKTANARVTVRHNGVVVQQDVELPKTTTAAPLPESPEPGPIYLQNHGNPVRYRNIWVAPRSAEQEAKRPIVPGFERFFSATGAEPAEGGRLLVGELNCTACHQADDALSKRLIARPAPVLDEVGKRAHPEFLLKYLAEPHAAKPGTTMPDVLGAMSPAERQEAALALVNLLVTTGTVPQQTSDPQAVPRGEKLFREVGCVACHAPRGGQPVSSKTTIPLGDLSQKYSIPSLTAFLLDPHKVRPAGRMPSLVQDNKEALDLANYLVGPVDVKPKNPNLRFAVYYGNWATVPKFDDLKSVKTGESAGFDTNVAGRGNDFGIRFDGFLKIDQDGDYTFHLGSDDGSLLYIDGKKVADSDGVHPHTVHTGSARLTRGMHPLRVDYTQGGGEASLTLEYSGPGIPLQDAGKAISLTEQGPSQPKTDTPPEKPGFTFDPGLVEKGRTLFTTVGCANCHQLKQGDQPLKSLLVARPLKDLKPDQGCLAATKAGVQVAAATTDPDLLKAGNTAKVSVPQFDLNLNQREALAAALTTPAPKEPLSNAELISHTQTAFNCSACHARGGVGGPERDRNPLFLTTIPEMGDEGRVPPPLDGVGDKLNDDWLRHVLQNGILQNNAKDRPYMLTRMPKFGLPNVTQLAAAFIGVDRPPATTIPPLTEAEHRVKAVGRQLVGDKALACIKCHTFGPHRATGIQAINLQLMTRRLREDWFFRYMVDPPRYRPGTRMPTGYPEGKAVIRDVYEGDPQKQLAAIWTYLKDGDRAGIPEGLVGSVIELKADKKPVIYRNFIEGLTPRGIAVGYPEHTHLAWDANKMCLTLIWHGRFIDAAKHWEGRGPGFQGPLGDHVMKLEDTVPFATLDSATAAWPTETPRDVGYLFKGYQLDAAGRPQFRYTAPKFTVVDYPKPVLHGTEGGYERRFTLTAAAGVDNVYFRAASAGKIEPQADGSYLIDGSVRLRLPGVKPVLRESAGRQELLVPIVFTDGKAELVEEISW